MEDATEAISVELKSPIGFPHAFVADNAPLAGFLNAAPDDADKLSTITDFFRGDKQEYTDIDLLQEIRHLETRLGAPPLNGRRVDQIYQYVKLQGQIKGLEKQRDAFLR